MIEQGDKGTVVQVWVHREANGSLLCVTSVYGDLELEHGDTIERQLVWIKDV